MGKNAVIIGATSGIGKALAEHLSAKGYILGLTGRRLNLLEDLQQNLPNKAIIQQMDVTDTEAVQGQFQDLVKQLETIDLVIINAGVGFRNVELDVEPELQTIDVNVRGFTVLATAAFKHFQENGAGHLVGISSILTLRGNPNVPAYNASKAYMSNYMEGLRLKALKEKLDITVTDIRPGFVDTAMIADTKNKFWVASPEKAASQIFDAIKSKKPCVYVTKRWRLIAWLIRGAPDFIYKLR